jgi:hypothetical protein
MIERKWRAICKPQSINPPVATEALSAFVSETKKPCLLAQFERLETGLTKLLSVFGGEAAIADHYAALSSASSLPCFQSHSRQRSMTPRLFSFLTTNLALQIGHGCGTGLSQATKSHCFLAQFEQP